MLAALAVLSSSPSAAQPDEAGSKRPDGLTTYPMPSWLDHLISGPDGNLWGTARPDGTHYYLYRISTQGVVTTYTLSSSAVPYADQLTVGPDNNIWISLSGPAVGTKLYRFDLANHTTTAFNIFYQGNSNALVTGADGNLWIATSSEILRCTQMGICDTFNLTSGFHYDFTPGANTAAVGADGNIWFLEYKTDSYNGIIAAAIGRITPAGVITDFPLPHFYYPPRAIARGPDGNIWFLYRESSSTMAVAQITPAGIITNIATFPESLDERAAITTGPDGNLWFTRGSRCFDHYGCDFGRLTPQGVLTWYSGGNAGDILTGPDNDLWLAPDRPYYSGQLPMVIKVDLQDGIPVPTAGTWGPTSLPTPIPTSVGTVVPPTPTLPPTGGMVWADVPSSDGFYPPITNLAGRGIVGGYPCGGVNPQAGQREPCGAAPSTSPPYYRPGNWVSRGQAAKIIALSAGLTGRVGRQTFADVPSTSVFFAPVEALAAAGLANGYRCGTSGEPCDDTNRPYFRPGANITRGQLAKLIGGAAGFGTVPPGQLFADVGPSNGFYGWVQQVGNRGIIGGYPCGGPNEPCDSAHRPYYRPGDPATRAQTAKIDAGVFP